MKKAGIALSALPVAFMIFDATLKFMAVEIAMANPDGYWTRASDYSIYQEENGRFHVLPYDFNEAMGVESPGRRGGFGASRPE